MDIFGFRVLRWVQINTESTAEPSNLSLEDVRDIFIFLLLFSLPLFWWRTWGSDKYKIMNYILELFAGNTFNATGSGYIFNI